jgi:signal transduction histidine kinase
MRSNPGRTRHLIFMAHLWVCAPFLVIWMRVPSVRVGIPPEGAERLQAFIVVVTGYLLLRTWLAFRDPKSLPWEYVFPPIDVAVISVLIAMGNKDPLGNVALLYFFPIAEAAGTLSVSWTISVAAMAIAGAGLASNGFVTTDTFATAFRYFFFLVMATLLTMLSRIAAAVREQAGVARDRNRIAMEMHDGVQGHLVTIARQLELAEAMATRDSARSAQIIGETRSGARLAADELRFLVQRLRAPSLAEGFLPALKQFAHNQTSRNGLELEFQVIGEPYILDADQENALFRIAQESLTNVVRHAEAKRVVVEVRYAPELIELQVRDDGKGFDDGIEFDSGIHAGLDGMRQRAQGLSGSVRIESKAGEGTNVLVMLPRHLERVNLWRNVSK